MRGMSIDLVRPPKARPGDKVAVLSPSFAAPGFAPQVHEQAMRRLAEVTGLVPVEYPTTRRLGASAQERADDVNAALSVGPPSLASFLMSPAPPAAICPMRARCGCAASS